VVDIKISAPLVRYLILFQDLRFTGGVRQAVKLASDLPSAAVTICIVPRVSKNLKNLLGFLKDLLLALRHKPRSVRLRVIFSALSASENEFVITTSKRTLEFVTNPSSDFHIHYFQHIEVWDFLNSSNFLEFCKHQGYPSAESMARLLEKALSGKDERYFKSLQNINKFMTVSLFLKDLVLLVNPKASVKIMDVSPHIVSSIQERTGKCDDILFFIRGLSFKGDDMSKDLVKHYSLQPLKINVISSNEMDSTCPSNVNIFVRPTDEQVAKLYATTKVVVHPSLSEGFGSIPQEALSFGCIVVGSKTGWLLNAEQQHNLKVIGAHQISAYKDAIDVALQE
jgi:glycosyltransferase involved in cell wall biosynthesis